MKFLLNIFRPKAPKTPSMPITSQALNSDDTYKTLEMHFRTALTSMSLSSDNLNFLAFYPSFTAAYNGMKSDLTRRSAKDNKDPKKIAAIERNLASLDKAGAKILTQKLSQILDQNAPALQLELLFKAFADSPEIIKVLHSKLTVLCDSKKIAPKARDKILSEALSDAAVTSNAGSKESVKFLVDKCEKSRIDNACSDALKEAILQDAPLRDMGAAMKILWQHMSNAEQKAFQKDLESIYREKNKRLDNIDADVKDHKLKNLQSLDGRFALGKPHEEPQNISQIKPKKKLTERFILSLA